MAHIWTTNFYGNPNVGLYAFATDKHCLMGYDLRKSIRKQIEEILNVPVHHMTMCGTPLLGVFLAGNKNCLLVPSICFDDEIEVLKRLKIKYAVIDTKLTALGNHILCNDHGCIVNPDFSDDAVNAIGKALKVDVHKAEIAGIKTVGSAAVANSTHCLVHRDAESKEIENIGKILKVEVETVKINMANPFLRSGIICNNHGLVVGDGSGGPEVTNADEALGYLEKYRRQ